MTQPRTALVVDDDAGSRRLLVRFLEQNGWRVLEACDGKAALQQARGALDLVLMDLRMPGPMDGIMTAFLLRREPAHRNLPIIALSASPLETIRDRALAAGCCVFLSKPVQLKQLQTEIERLVPVSEAP